MLAALLEFLFLYQNLLSSPSLEDSQVANEDAANLLLFHPSEYQQRVRQCVAASQALFGTHVDNIFFVQCFKNISACHQNVLCYRSKIPGLQLWSEASLQEGPRGPVYSLAPQWPPQFLKALTWMCYVTGAHSMYVQDTGSQNAL